MPAALRPADRKLLDVRVAGVTDADGDPLEITITGVTQDEPLLGRRPRPACPDAVGAGTGSLWLRAERRGRGDGRVYQVSFEAADGRGGRCTGAVGVCVPRDRQAGELCRDQGPLVDALAPGCVGPCAAVCEIERELARAFCAGERVPAGVTRLATRARLLAERAASTQSPRRAQRLVRRALRLVRTADRRVARAGAKQALSPGCEQVLGAALAAAQTQCEQFLIP